MIEEKAEVEPPIMENPYWHGPKGRGQGGAAGSAFQHRMPCVPMVGQAQALHFLIYATVCSLPCGR